MRTMVDLPEPLLRVLKARAGLKETTLAAELREIIEAGLGQGESVRAAQKIPSLANVKLAALDDLASRERPRPRRPARRLRGEALAAELRAISCRAAALIPHPVLAHAAWMYDEHGLPK